VHILWAVVQYKNKSYDLRKETSMHHVSLTAVPNVPLMKSGDSVGNVVINALRGANIELKENDVIVLASKIVSKAEGQVRRLESVTPSERAQEIATTSGKDPRVVELMLEESKAILDVRPGVVVTVHRLGFVCTSAGIDRANVEDGTVSLLPQDPDKSAVEIRRLIMEVFGFNVAVVINDSFGIEYRAGSIGLALGVAGIPALLQGSSDEKDLYNRKRNVSIMLADEISAAASLLMGQSSAGMPLVVISGLQYPITEESKITDLVVTSQIEATLARQNRN
jgi:coenzyme F420-0:L-glutamate ligase/coenzyme F420-1:gamma-L-glutamate ligase